MAQEIATLIRKRAAKKSKLTRIANHLEDFKTSEGKSIEQLKVRLGEIRPLLKEFEKIQDEIELLEPEDAQTDERAAFETTCFDLIAEINTIINESTTAPTVVSNTGKLNTVSTTKLPLQPIKLPVFDCTYGNWVSFRDTFTALVHSDASLQTIEKLHHLRASLSGEAARTIQALELSAANYEVAWAALKRRFEKRQLITQHHANAILNLAPIVKESPVALRQLADTVHSHVNALKALKEPVEHWDLLLICIISEKLDFVTKREWKAKAAAMETPKMDDLNEFLAKRCDLLESLAEDRRQVRPTERSRCHVVTSKGCCSICNQTHTIAKCEEFIKMTVPARLKTVQRHKLCINCLRPGHFARECRSGSCRKCGKAHNTFLHSEDVRFKPKQEASGLEEATATSSTVTTNCAQESNSQVVLSTAVVLAFDQQGRTHECRVLLDCGSQAHFITEAMCAKLDLTRKPTNVPISGISNASTTALKQATVKIRSQQNAFQTSISCLVLPAITEQLPTAPLSIKTLQIPANIKLADPTFYIPNKVDMLIGAALFWDLLCVGQIKPGRYHPTIQKTKLGWILSGSHSEYRGQKTTKVCNLSLSRLESQIQKFWEIEEIPETKQTFSKSEELCEAHFTATTSRGQDGRFIVRLPLVEARDALGESREMATKRLYQIERRLARDEELKTFYHGFMLEYLNMKHMEEVNESDADYKRFYLPHHGVWKDDSTTTKLRVVFDASAKTSSGLSLNDIMRVGPTIQQDLLAIVLRFRIYKYVLTADIAKMYRQVWVHEADRDLQTILWRPAPTEPIKTYRLATVTYGTAAASFLATRCLHEIADLEKKQYPKLETTIKQDFYMDDLLTGADTIEEVKWLKIQTQQTLNKYGFELRKWCSNHALILDDSKNEGTLKGNVVTISEGTTIKTLGLGWNPSEDVLQYSARTQPKKIKITKRSVLSQIAQIFDPLGLLNPFLISAKIILQQIWQERLGWDESLPARLYTTWEQCYHQLAGLNKLKLPRSVISIAHPVKLEVHGFSDASEAAYGAAIYIRASNAAGKVETNLLCSKTRVAPLKQVSLPRLELCGALLLAQLYTKVIKSINKEHVAHFWTDSTIVLAWLNGSPNQWQTFVANRVAQIQDLTINTQWRHINTKENPADLLTRGVTVEVMQTSMLWWAGPTWLAQSHTEWPASSKKNVEAPERRKIKQAACMATTTSANSQFVEQFSTLSRAQRVAAYCRRFIHNTRVESSSRKYGPLSVLEVQTTLMLYIAVTQQREFCKDIQALKNEQRLPTASKIQALNPFLDEQGLLRVGGRLAHAPIAYATKHPLILPSSGHLTMLIINHTHLQNLHSGVQATLAALRLMYWPLNGRSTVRKYLRRCMICFRQRPATIFPQMGNLPPNRVTPAPAFHSVGVDYAGPIYVKTGNRRSRTMLKGYISVFICFATKAIHLEAVSDLTTAAFLAAFHRFVGRRGRPAHVHSDNGTNFVGAWRELKELSALLQSSSFQNNVIRDLTNKCIQWHFIPPHSPHFGGLWEAGVKSVKFHLRRIMGNSKLTFEEMQTCLIQIEAVLNSRPLQPLTQDPDDLSPLTPAHFLIGRSLTAVPDASYVETPRSRLSRWQHVQQLSQQFWRRWSRDYMPQLQARVKWQQHSSVKLQVGDLVLLKADNLAPTVWKLGRVLALHPGVDGIARVATIKTATHEVKRCLTKLCPLPIDECSAGV